uniref:Thrombomodulin n=1 Tax=Denticeps clupeoides TaxID=299321 RepID=A0AAY4CA91_9TELE
CCRYITALKFGHTFFFNVGSALCSRTRYSDMGRLARVLVLVAALLRGAGGGDVAPESCVDRRCFAVAAERADFSRAAAECVRGGARLLSAPLVPDVALLLRGLPGVFWTALTERDCPDCPGGPAGCVGLSRDCVDARCVCGKGRAVARDGWSCVAAGGDPCDLADCEHVCTCVNTDGGYRCECMPGYTLARDRGTCELHCPAAECPAVCDVNDDSQCECPHGFLLDVRPREKVCVDIDECDMFFCEQGCDNSYGGYACWCRAGYELVAEYRCVPGPDDDAADVTATPSAAPATERPPARSPGRAVAVAVCAAVAVLVVALIARHVVKRRRTRALAVDACVLSQVASDKHDMPSSGRRFKADN